MDTRVEAIRKDPCVGHSSCTSVDECFSDNDLVRHLNSEGISLEKDAVEWARDYEQMFMEQLLNTRWGSDDDPQLAEYKAWIKKLEDNPV